MTTLPRLEQIEVAARLIATAMKPTSEICWPTLSARCGGEVWVKHENHTPIGSFKVRGGLVYVDDLLRRGPAPLGIIAATRQSRSKHCVCSPSLWFACDHCGAAR